MLLNSGFSLRGQLFLDQERRCYRFGTGITKPFFTSLTAFEKNSNIAVR
jgi:hypothetical protein